MHKKEVEQLKYKIINSILVILIFINILLGVYLIFYADTVPTFSLDSYKHKMGFYNSMNEVNIYYFENYEVLEKNYKGEVDLYYLIDAFNILIDNYLQELENETKDLSAEELEAYFNTNKEKIGIRLGLADFEEFSSIIDMLKENSIEGKKYAGSKLIKEKIVDNERYVIFDLEIYFEDATLKLEVRLSNIDNTKEAIIKFTPAKEEL